MKTIVVEQSINHNIEYSTSKILSRNFISQPPRGGMLLISQGAPDKGGSQKRNNSIYILKILNV